MANRDDGGPAFPVALAGPVLADGKTRGPLGNLGGMSLRDWFAGQALSGLLLRAGWEPENDPKLVAYSYRLADAMLAERDKANG